MIAFSVKNLDARWSVSEELVLSFVKAWVARCEDEIIGVYQTRTMAEHSCRWSASQMMCLEEAV